jgi:hypothetical protein
VEDAEFDLAEKEQQLEFDLYFSMASTRVTSLGMDRNESRYWWFDRFFGTHSSESQPKYFGPLEEAAGYLFVEDGLDGSWGYLTKPEQVSIVFITSTYLVLILKLCCNID